MAVPDRLVALLFRFLLPALVLAMQYMLYRKVCRWFGGRYPGRVREKRWIIVPFILFNITLVIVTVFRPDYSGMPVWMKYGLAYPFFIWHAATFFIALVIIIGTIIALPVRIPFWIRRAIKRWRNPSPPVPVPVPVNSRRSFLRKSLYGLTAVSFAGSSYGVVYGRTRCEVRRTDIHIDNLPPEFEGFRIGMISDVHSSVFMPVEDMKRYVETMNTLGTDLVAVTGDFVNSKLEEAHPFAEAFHTLKAPHGVYGVLGNHDYFTRDVDKVARIVDDCGVKILRNDAVKIGRNGGHIVLAGLDDIGRPDAAREAIAAALRGTPRATPRILLCHRPYFLPQASEQDIDLMLSGHTHGGQISLGTIGGTPIAPASLASPYVWGGYREGKAQMYVNRGIGTVGLPIRLNCPPELTVIRLTGGAPMASRLDRMVTIS